MALLLLWDFETGFVDIVAVMVISTLLEALQVYGAVVMDRVHGGCTMVISTPHCTCTTRRYTTALPLLSLSP